MDGQSFVHRSGVLENKFNKPAVLPVTEDLLTLRKFMMIETEKVKTVLQQTPNTSSWRELAELLLARITLFNKCMSTEVSKLKLEAYLNRPDWKSSINEEIRQSLLPDEFISKFAKIMDEKLGPLRKNDVSQE